MQNNGTEMHKKVCRTCNFFLLIRSIDSVAVAIAVAVFIILVNESFAISPILLAEILAYNKSALCRSASLAFSFVIH